MNARYDKSFKTPLGFSRESSIPYLPANKVPSKGAREKGFLEKPPQTLMLDSVPCLADVPLETLRPLIFGKQKEKCPCTALSFPEAAAAFRGGSNLSSHCGFTERSDRGGSSSCAVKGAANVEPPDN